MKLYYTNRIISIYIIERCLIVLVILSFVRHISNLLTCQLHHWLSKTIKFLVHTIIVCKWVASQSHSFSARQRSCGTVTMYFRRRVPVIRPDCNIFAFIHISRITVHHSFVQSRWRTAFLLLYSENGDDAMEMLAWDLMSVLMTVTVRDTHWRCCAMILLEINWQMVRPLSRIFSYPSAR